MGRVLIIGAGGVATVAAHKVAQNPQVFTEVMIASRTEKKCIDLANVLNRKYGQKKSLNLLRDYISRFEADKE